MLKQQLIPTITCVSDKHLVTKRGTHLVCDKTLYIATDGFVLVVVYDKRTATIFQLELDALLLANVILYVNVWYVQTLVFPTEK